MLQGFVLPCLALIVLLLLAAVPAARAAGGQCVGCHLQVTPGIVKDFESSLMARSMDCSACHGSAHHSEEDAERAKLPTAKTCRPCHKEQYERFAAGKHALGWAATEAMPTTGIQPHAFTFGLKGCGGCHKIGLRDRDPGRYGSPCDSCQPATASPRPRP